MFNRFVLDFRTIAEFRQKHTRQIEKIFLAFARACWAMKLVGADMIYLDGMTIRASNSRKKSTNKEISQKKLNYVQSQLGAIRWNLKFRNEEDLHDDRIDHPYVLDLDKGHLSSLESLEERHRLPRTRTQEVL
ncbi:MAG: hypothetical protein Q4E13_05705 [Clostridia bacterium]|nr:hypothetical protein [Clostridia bacterium]